MLFEHPSEMETDPIYIDNAGLVLAGNFLPRLFETLEMLELNEDGKRQFRDSETALRAVHLLQYLVDGRTNILRYACLKAIVRQPPEILSHDLLQAISR